MAKQSEERKYDLRLSLDLIVAYRDRKGERSKRIALFNDCRIIQLDLDLLGVLICGGAIGNVECYQDAIEFERKRRGKALEFDFPQTYNPLEDCLGFFIQMIPPGGEIAVIARNFQLE